MGSIIIRTIIVILAGIGVYKIFPQVQVPVDYYLKNPQFQNSVISPAITMANKVLPAKIQIPTPAAVMGVSVDASAVSPVKQITDEVSKQAANLANEQIIQIKKTATDNFCKVLIEKIQSECGQTPTPTVQP
jgi:hypothetical protein